LNVGTGAGHVEIAENRNELVKEASRLSRTGYLPKKFIDKAKTEGVDIEQGKILAIFDDLHCFSLQAQALKSQNLNLVLRWFRMALDPRQCRVSLSSNTK
jgi:hypothetical protein